MMKIKKHKMKFKKITDNFILLCDDTLKNKEKEILTV